jgi:hypothetical protein
VLLVAPEIATLSLYQAYDVWPEVVLKVVLLIHPSPSVVSVAVGPAEIVVVMEFELIL